MAGLLEGRVIAMTGAGRGIGRECALLAAAEGARVVVNDPGVSPDGQGHDDGPAAQVVDEIKKNGGEAVANFADVSTMAGGESVIQSALDTFGRLDGLINLAAILRDRMVFNLTEEEWDDVIRVDLKGHFTTIKPAAIVMRQQRYGRIVNFSSVSGLQGNSGQANYGAAKAGVGGLTRVAARDLGRYGVTVNAIAPGAATRLTATVPDSARELRASRGIAGGRWRFRRHGHGQPRRRGGRGHARPRHGGADDHLPPARRRLERQRQDLPGRGRPHRTLQRAVPAAPQHL